MWIVVLGCWLSFSAGPSSVRRLATTPRRPYAGTGGAQGATVIADDPAGAGDPKVLERLDAFCKKWMGFLVVREVDNKKAVKWRRAGRSRREIRGLRHGLRVPVEGGKADPKAKAKRPGGEITYREYLYSR